LLVGSTLLARLGTAYTLKTDVLGDAPINGGTLTGNLYLRGGGDALLTEKDLDDAADSLVAAGLKRVTGSITTDASRYDNQRLGFGWSVDDLPYYYAPVVSALELEDGVLHVHMLAGPTVGAPVQLRVKPVSNTYTIDNQLTTAPATGKDTSDISRVWDQPRTIRLTGTYPLGAKESGDLVPSVPDPESYAGDVFLRALQARGVTIAGGVAGGKTPAAARTLWSHASEPVPQLLADFWYPSDNLMGELFLKELAAAGGVQPGTDANGAKLEQAWLRSIGVQPDTVTIGDGSGLSQYDRITPHDLHEILQADWNGPNRNVVLNALPVSGVRGSLRNSYKGTAAERKVFAKTGSISHVRTISGFVITKSHGPVTFSFMINDWMGEDKPHGAADLAKVRGEVFAQLAAQ
ncbi:MAG: D-alanyl-D-alanine carboxypeptidase/D-alanyl-D-alanine-endopeptidase, partial [Candidatus Eremiobacteraeota bacterium]|nr:D-alanyl-D-alanine carboxypeptidase/D-alanyl-D-alanine-endopeptidase [Candidatus Eremiobacteraeota bacterium]